MNVLFKKVKNTILNSDAKIIDEVLGYEHNVEEDKDVTEVQLFLILLDMTDEELFDLYNKYFDDVELEH